MSRRICWRLFALAIILSGIGCGKSIWDKSYLSPSTALTKQRHYEMEYETVFKAAYQAVRKTGLHVAKLDPQMGTILASRPIGAYSSGWADGYVIFVESSRDNRTLVQVKYQPVREGAVYTPLSSPESAQSSSFVRTDWQTSTRKVNHLFAQIQRELGIEDIFGIRGLME
ncbi:MAG: hypothetical protein O7E52_07395 [Candidatus Poribacteria bacterium]|nr:hypothetical protein [Candidatus Poribacteria bacterium]